MSRAAAKTLGSQTMTGATTAATLQPASILPGFADVAGRLTSETGSHRAMTSMTTSPSESCGYDHEHDWQLRSFGEETYWHCRECGYYTQNRYCRVCDSGQDRPCGQEECPL